MRGAAASPISLRFTLQSLLIGVALIGINVAGAIATLRYFPRDRIHGGSIGERGMLTSYGLDGSISTYRMVENASPPDSEQLIKVVRRPPPPSLLVSWSPVVASVSLSVLIVSVCKVRRGVGSQEARNRGPSVRRSQLLLVALWTAIALALGGINLAGAVYRPPPSRSERDWQFLDVRRDFATIVVRDDGGISGYEGKPGGVRSRAHVIRPPTRSFLDVWSFAIFSLSIDVGVLVLILRRGSPRDLAK